MEAPRRTVLAALSAEAQVIERLRRLCGESDGLELVFANEPGELVLGVIASLAESQVHAAGDRAGVLIDLTTPRSRSAHDRRLAASKAVDDQTYLEAATEIIHDVNKLFGTLKIGSTTPLIVVSADGRLRAHLDALGLAVRGCLSPADDDATWRLALDTVLAERRQSKRTASRRGKRKPQRIIPPATGIPLSEDLWFDPAACELLRRERRIPLTARESSLLSILLRTPSVYIPASELARRLTPPGGYPVDAHSIEQTVSTLRHKLGDSKGKLRLLRVRRGVGYGIFPEITEAIPARTTDDTRAKAVEFGRLRRLET